MKKIGIIDYFIDEWHSNVYTELFEKANALLDDYRNGEPVFDDDEIVSEDA